MILQVSVSQEKQCKEVNVKRRNKTHFSLHMPVSIIRVEQLGFFKMPKVVLVQTSRPDCTHCFVGILQIHTELKCSFHLISDLGLVTFYAV